MVNGSEIYNEDVYVYKYVYSYMYIYIQYI